jgi:hypothetical protein
LINERLSSGREKPTDQLGVGANLGFGQKSKISFSQVISTEAGIEKTVTRSEPTDSFSIRVDFES